MKSTISDVAKKSGVSITTVSRVINNNYPVKAETRVKVEEAIKLLNFTPNILARGLINNKTYTIGVVVPSITNFFFSVAITGVQKFLEENNYTIILSYTDGKSKSEKTQINNLLERLVDGIIIFDPTKKNTENGFLNELNSKIPLVIVNGNDDDKNCNYVLNNQKKGTLDALQHLFSLGHKNIAFVRGGSSYSYDLKEKVFFDFVKTNKLANNLCPIITIDKGNSINTVEMTKHALNSYLSKKNRPTGIFACNDFMAIGALNSANENKISVPKNLSIIGFDNTIISEISIPKLTTVDQNMEFLGLQSATMLLNIIENVKTSKKIILETRLIVRESCYKI